MNTKTLSILPIMILLTISCGSRPTVYVKPSLRFAPGRSLAILPFNNYSGKEDAGKQVSNAFLIELLKKQMFNIIEPGEIDKIMREERIRSSDQVDEKTALKLKEKLSADYILIGSVNEYGYLRSGDREIPIIGFSIRLLDSATGQIIWAAYHSRKGDDKELIFSWRLVTSLSKLAQNSVHDVVKKL